MNMRSVYLWKVSKLSAELLLGSITMLLANAHALLDTGDHNSQGIAISPCKCTRSC